VLERNESDEDEVNYLIMRIIKRSNNEN